MYSPSAFRVDDPKKITSFIETHSFGTLVTCHNACPSATHLPFRPLIDEGVCKGLATHMARANPQWKQFEDSQEVLVLFTGPHAYVSPAWYVAEHAVPTWNYTAVHVLGKPRILQDKDQVMESMRQTVDYFELSRETPWRENLPADLRDRMLQEIVVFEIDVLHAEGKFKLSQNRPLSDRERVHQALNSSTIPMDRQLAEWMVSEGVLTG